MKKLQVLPQFTSSYDEEHGNQEDNYVGTLFVIGRLDGIWIAGLFVDIPSMVWMVRAWWMKT